MKQMTIARTFYVCFALLAGAVNAAAPCPPSTAICTVPLNFDEPDTAQPDVVAEPTPAPTPIPTPPPTPVVTQAAEPAPPLPVPALPAPAPVPLASGILDVLDWQLREYWLLSGDERPVQQLRGRGRCERAAITARFVVNNKGYTDEVRVLRNTALNPFYERRVEERIRSRFYTPARANPQRQSVRVEETFRFSC